MPRKSSIQETETPVSTPSVKKMEMKSTAKKSGIGKKKSSTPARKASKSDDSEQQQPEVTTPIVVVQKDKTTAMMKKASAKKSTAKKKKSQTKNMDEDNDVVIVAENENPADGKFEVEKKKSKKPNAALSQATTDTPKTGKPKVKSSAKKSAKKIVDDQVDTEENNGTVAAVKVQLPRPKTPKSTRGSKRKIRPSNEENTELADTSKQAESTLMDTEKDQPKKTKTPKSGRSNRKSSKAVASAEIGTKEEKEPSTKKKESPKPVGAATNTEKERTKKRLSFGGDAADTDEATNTQQTATEQPFKDEEITPTIGSSKKKKSGVKRRTSGKFDLPRLDDDDDTKTPVNRKKMRRSTESTPNTTKGDTPIKMNTEMTAAKLRLLNQSPLRSKLSKKWLAAAESEVLANGNDSNDNQLPSVIPLAEGASDEETDNEEEEADKEDDPELTRAKRKAARQTKWKARKLREKGKLPSDSEKVTNTGVVYIGHVPHGFYEREMRRYFKQFGDVTRLRLSRSKKTGRSRGYAFVEFADEQVAEVAAKAMDGYLMHGQALVAKFVPPEKVHEDTFKGCEKSFKKVAWSAVERRNMIERSRKPEMLAIRCGRVEKSKKRKEAALKKRGLSYDFPEVSSTA